VDARNLQDLATKLPAIGTLPLTFALCFGILFKYLGLTFFVGIGVFVLSIVFNLILSRILEKYQKQYMQTQDARVSMTTECMNNIKMIKMYSWIEIFQRLVTEKRQKELSSQFKRM
jgi:ABC-type bacteriocin/lantibiotic exporter with double-glycine peptidase domain